MHKTIAETEIAFFPKIHVIALSCNGDSSGGERRRRQSALAAGIRHVPQRPPKAASAAAAAAPLACSNLVALIPHAGNATPKVEFCWLLAGKKTNFCIKKYSKN